MLRRAWQLVTSWRSRTSIALTRTPGKRGANAAESDGGIVPPAGLNINPSVLLAMDPPLHTEYRRMVIKSFVPRSIAAIEADVRDIAQEAGDEFARNGGGDFVIDIASAIPFRVMAQ